MAMAMAPADATAKAADDATPTPAASSALHDPSPKGSLQQLQLQRPDRRSWLEKFTQDINLSYADLPVLACCTCSGLCDSAAFTAGGVFVSMQTGEPSPRHPFSSSP
jgi:hypothetical protein